MSDDQVKEASWVAQSVTGLSAYFCGIGYSREQLGQEIEKIVQYITKSAQE